MDLPKGDEVPWWELFEANELDIYEFAMIMDHYYERNNTIEFSDDLEIKRKLGHIFKNPILEIDSNYKNALSSKVFFLN